MHVFVWATKLAMQIRPTKEASWIRREDVCGTSLETDYFIDIEPLGLAENRPKRRPQYLRDTAGRRCA